MLPSFVRVLCLFCFCFSLNAQSLIVEKDRVGWVEWVQFAAHLKLKAKLDSGAKTSSLDAREVELFSKGGESWVRFQLVYKSKKNQLLRKAYERPLVRKVKIKRHGSASQRRPVVAMDFCFNGRMHRTEFSLVTRSQFIYPILLGRDFLADWVMIDPGETYIAARCDGVSAISRNQQTVAL